MKVAKGKAVKIHYTLKSEGETIDSTHNDAPMGYLHGHSNLMPGLEDALEGKELGDKFSIELTPDQAFGPHDPQHMREEPKEQFSQIDELTPGMHLQVKSEQGVQIATIVKISDETVTVDFNHPLAGKTLHFELEVLDVQDATDEELTKGHICRDDNSCCE